MFFTIVGVIVVLLVCGYCLLLGAVMFLGNLTLSNLGGEMWFGLILMISSVFIGYQTVAYNFNISFQQESTQVKGTQ